MRNQKLQCLILGKSPVFLNLLISLSTLDAKTHLRQSPNIKKNIIAALQAMKGPALIFVSDDSPYPLKQLSLLLSQYKPEAIVIIASEKTVSTSIKKLFNNTFFAKLNVQSNNSEIHALLNSYAYIASRNMQFRRFKALLGNSERRNICLIDSSREAIALVFENKIVKANASFLILFEIIDLDLASEINFRDFIENDEIDIFNGFMKYQFKHQKLSHNLLLSMKNGFNRRFRSKVYAFPATYKGEFCWQLQIKEIQSEAESHRQEEMSLKKNTHLEGKAVEKVEKNPFLALTEELSDKMKQADSDLVLKGLINRNEIRISAQQLKSIQYERIKPHFLLSLKVPIAQKKSVNQLLFGPTESDWSRKRDIFWDKAMVLSLIQIMLRNKKTTHSYFISLSPSSTSDPSFVKWMMNKLQLLGQQKKNLIFVFSPNFKLIDQTQISEIVNHLKKMKCGVAIHEFTTSKNSLLLLKLIKPGYINLSEEWVHHLESDKQKELALGRLVHQLEERHIKVIVPCRTSPEMKKIFSISGASFCQERSTRVAQKLYN